MSVRIIIGDALTELAKLPAESVHCCVTSPPYFGLRDYGCAGQLGLEATPDEYVAAMVGVFREVRRVLRADGTLWLNLGDSYAGSWGAQSRGNFPSEKSTLTTNGGRGPKAGDKYSALSATQIAAHPHITHTGSIRQPGIKPKDLIGIPWMLAFALRADGWWLRQDIIWSKPNPMPESVTDRCTKAHEYLFLLSKSATYFYDADAVREELADDRSYPDWESRKKCGAGSGNRELSRWSNEKAGAGVGANPNGRNKRSVWTIATAPYAEAHFATFPPALVEPCIMAGCPRWRGVVLDPFLGAGTTALVADRLGRSAIGIELNPTYAAMARRRIADDAGMFFEAAE